MAKLVIAGPDFAQDFIKETTPRLQALGHQVIERIGGLDQLADCEGWAETDLLIAVNGSYGRPVMESAPKLRAIVSPIIGIDGIDMPAATELGILVANGRVAENTESMAEATVMLMLAASYDLPGSIARMRDPAAAHRQPGMIGGKTIGLIGYGAIARAVTARLQGWGANLIVYTRHAPEVAPDGVAFVPLDTLLRESHIVLVLTSLSAETRHLLDAARLGLMRPGAILVNTARGAIVDEGALAARLREGAIGCAALDVFETEPLPADNPLRSLPNVLLTPHCAGQTRETWLAMPEALLANVRSVLEGALPASTCNPAIAERWLRRWSVAA